MRLQIEKLVYGGEGLARSQADESGRRMAVFVPFTLPGEEVIAETPRRQGGMARAQLRDVITASSQRVSPPCPHFGICGGCQLQHGSYELQLASKVSTLRETFERAHLDLLLEISTLACDPWGYRNRIRLHVDQSSGWQAGYLERRSNRLMPVETCPIAAPVLQKAISVLSLEAVAQAAPRGLVEFEIFCNHDQSRLTIAAWWRTISPISAQQFNAWGEAVRSRLPELSGAWAFESHPESSPVPAVQIGAPLTYQVGGNEYEVSPGAFFQVNRHLTADLTSAVVSKVAARAGERILDLYAGAGLFSVPLARAKANVTAVEIGGASFANLSQNLAPFPSARAIESTTLDYLARLLHDANRPDAIVVDPPRAGLGKEVTHLLAKIRAPRLVYLSCDPATLARDLHALLTEGYRAESITLIDLFPQTFHIETLVSLRHHE